VEQLAWAFGAVMSRSARMASEPGVEALLPWIDMLNHSCSSQSFIDIDRALGEVFVASDRPIARGEEVRISYGAKSSVDIVLNYGFCPDDNEHESAPVALVLDPAGARRVESLLTQEGIPEAMQICLVDLPPVTPSVRVLPSGSILLGGGSGSERETSGEEAEESLCEVPGAVCKAPYGDEGAAGDGVPLAAAMGRAAPTPAAGSLTGGTDAAEEPRKALVVRVRGNGSMPDGGVELGAEALGGGRDRALGALADACAAALRGYDYTLAENRVALAEAQGAEADMSHAGSSPVFISNSGSRQQCCLGDDCFADPQGLVEVLDRIDAMVEVVAGMVPAWATADPDGPRERPERVNLAGGVGAHALRAAVAEQRVLAGAEFALRRAAKGTRK